MLRAVGYPPGRGARRCVALRSIIGPSGASPSAGRRDRSAPSASSTRYAHRRGLQLLRRQAWSRSSTRGACMGGLGIGMEAGPGTWIRRTSRLVAVADCALLLLSGTRLQQHPEQRRGGQSGVERSRQPVPAAGRPGAQPRRHGEGLCGAGEGRADRRHRGAGCCRCQGQLVLKGRSSAPSASSTKVRILRSERSAGTMLFSVATVNNASCVPPIRASSAPSRPS